ncbi:MAG: RNA polymerase sigma factor [Myxococcota bacterium]
MAKSKVVGAARTQQELPDLGALYEEHFSFVWRSLIRLGLSSSSAEDVAQDVFLVVRRRLPDYDPAFPMRAWLFGISRRVAKDHRRSAQRAARRLEALPPVEPPPDPESRASAREAADLVNGFLEQLDEGARALFVLCELEDLSGTEASAALGLNRNTLYSQRRKLRVRFEKYVRRAQRQGRRTTP